MWVLTRIKFIKNTSSNSQLILRVQPEQRRALGEERVLRRQAAVGLQDVSRAHGRVQHLVRVEARVSADCGARH